MSLLSALLVTLAGLSLAMMVVSWMIASRSAREARTTIFPIVREEETTRARRARIMTSLTGVVAAIMAGAFFLSGQLPVPAVATQMVAKGTTPPTETVAATAPPTAKAVAPAAPTNTPLPATEPPATVQPTATPTTSPAAEVLLPTATLPPATVGLTATQVTPDTPTPAPPGTEALAGSQPTVSAETLQSQAVTPLPTNTQMGPIAFSTQVTARRQPINPTTVFSDTVSRIYAVFPYRGMRNGMTWTQVWYFNGVEFDRGQDTWNWGNTDLSYVFIKVVGVGTYRLELYVNNTLLASGEFAVQGPAAIGGPQNP